MDENVKENEVFSRMIVEFENAGSAHFGLKIENVTPLQMLALAGYLEFEAKSNLSIQRNIQLQREFEREQMNKLAVPPGTILKR